MPFSPVPRVKPGDTVAVVAPSGPFELVAFEAGLKPVAARYQPLFDDGLFTQARYLAGDDRRRLGEFHHAWADEKVKAVFTARGGYGAMRLLPALRFDEHKPFIGFSDVTAVHCALQASGMRSLHGPVLTQLGTQSAESQLRLFGLLESVTPPAPLDGTETLVSGVAEGPLLGGNLSVLTRLLGTPFLPPLRGAVLLLEDVGERPYRLDRMWTHLRLAGVFSQVAGLALGTFTGCEEKDAKYTSAQVLLDLAKETGLPCAMGFPVGHGTANLAVPLGAQVRLDAGARRLEFREGLVG